jgi:integrase
MVIELDVRKKRGKASSKSLTEQEKVKLINTFENLNSKKDLAILILGAYAGLRVGEISQVRKEWLNLIKIKTESGEEKEILEINIPEESYNLRTNYKGCIFRPKNRKARTTFIFDLKKAYFIKNYFDYENVAISRQAILYRVYSWNKILERQKLFLTVHALRSTATNYMIYELKLAPEFVQMCLGHSDIRTTYENYRSIGKPQQISYLMGAFK